MTNLLNPTTSCDSRDACWLDCKHMSRALTQATAVFGGARGTFATAVAAVHKATKMVRAFPEEYFETIRS